MRQPPRPTDRGCAASSQPSTTSISVSSTISVSLAAGADAVGDATLAQVDGAITVVSRGLISYATGALSAVAAAEGDAAYAATYLAVGLSDATIIQWDETAPLADPALQISSLSFAAIDLGGLAAVGLDLPHGGGSHCGADASGCSPTTPGDATTPSVAIAGNLAQFDVNLAALGDDGLVDLSADATALAGLSSVAVNATAAVAATTDYQMIRGGHGRDHIVTTDAASIVQGAGGADVIRAGAGADWLFGGGGDDQITCGTGDDAAYGGGGDDRLDGGDGSDWLFGGRGDDHLDAGAGCDLLLGGVGADGLNGQDGDDLLDGGRGNDRVSGGAGNDLFRLGADHGDGDDRYDGGAGADGYWLTGAFGHDRITDFSIAAGDRILCTISGGAGPRNLPGDDGAALTMCRARGDADDLVLRVSFGHDGGMLTLDEFFAQNPGFDAAVPARGDATAAQAAPLLAALFGDDAGGFAAAGSATFLIGTYLSELG